MSPSVPEGNHSSGDLPQPGRPDCPICGGDLEVVYDRSNQRVFVCKDCHSGLTVPQSAWEVARLKREKKWHG
jgi:hypothetical protein